MTTNITTTNTQLEEVASQESIGIINIPRSMGIKGRRLSDITAATTDVSMAERVEDAYDKPVLLVFGGPEHEEEEEPKVIKTVALDLELSGRPFFGRQQELERLHQIYHQEDDTSGPSSILIQGASGTGKTALVQYFVQQLQETDDQPAPLILQGKYEEMTRQDPFSALEQAFGDYFRSTTTDVVVSKRRRHKLLKAIGGETGLEVLRGVIPALPRWITNLEQESSNANTDESSQGSEQSRGSNIGVATTSKSHQLQYVFRRLVEALTVLARRPLVLLLDNLQWIDAASLDLLVYLVKQNIPEFHLIGTFRTTRTVGDGDTVSSDPEEVAQRRLADYSHQIMLENPSREEMATFVHQEFQWTTDALAEAVYEKTQGNFLFTLHLMQELQQYHEDDRDLLQCVEQSSAHTVGDAVSEKICHISSPQVKRALLLASYLGSQFTVATLQSLARFIHTLEDEQDQSDPLLSTDDPSNVVQLLDGAVLEGLLYNNVGSTAYQFTHSGIQEAAYNLIPVGPKRDQMLYQVGKFIQETLLATNENMLFVAARHWGEIRQNDYVEPLELAKLFLHCGTKALGMTAFEESGRCLKNGLDSIHKIKCDDPDQLWTEHYELTLELYRSAAQVELLLGHYEKGYSMGNLVLEKAANLLDKMPMYYAMDAALGLQDRHDEALNLNLEVLTELDQYPSTIRGIRDFFQVKALIRDTSDEDILSLPEMTDPYMIASIRCLSNAGTRAFCSGKMLMLMGTCLKQVRLIFEHGLCPDAALAFANYGCALLSGMGHPNTGRRMGRIARELTSMDGYNSQACRTLYMVGSFIEIWKLPYDTTIERLERAHELGLMTGNHDYGYGAEMDAITTCFMAGRPLERISYRFQRLKKEVDQYNLDALKRVLEPFGELLYYLVGQHPDDETGKHVDPSCIDWDGLEVTEELRPDSSNHYTLTWAYLDRMILSYFMDNTPFAERMTKKYIDIAPGQSYAFCTLGSFFCALVYTKLARKSRSCTKYKRLAQKHTKDFNKLLENGCTKNDHKYDLLKAECMSLNNTPALAIREAYDVAIASAKESGCLQDYALANELTGDYYLRQTQPHLANCFIVVACSLYRQWGANTKVQQLLQKYGLTEADLPTAATPSVKDEIAKSAFYPAINLGSTVGGSGSGTSDDLSALTPIPENSSLRLTNRWETGVTTKKDISCAPPRTPRRSA